MIARWVWIALMSLCMFGCGETTLRPFVDVSDGGLDARDDDGDDDDDDHDAGEDEHDGGEDDDDADGGDLEP